jgi:hypothetical protein
MSLGRTVDQHHNKQPDYQVCCMGFGAWLSGRIAASALIHSGTSLLLVGGNM